MRRGGWLVLLALAGTSGAAAHPPATAPPAATSCDEARRNDGWCESGNVGYVASVAIRSRMLFEALDAHGHAIDPTGIACETCRAAIASDGFCGIHRMGYVGGEAYLSPLTWHIARSRRIEPASIACRTCRKHTRGIGWCDRHGVGIAGRVAIDDRRRFEEFREAYRLLLDAIEMSDRCETCAAAMVAQGYCPIHRTRFKEGRAVAQPPP